MSASLWSFRAVLACGIAFLLAGGTPARAQETPPAPAPVAEPAPAPAPVPPPPPAPADGSAFVTPEPAPAPGETPPAAPEAGTAAPDAAGTTAPGANPDVAVEAEKKSFLSFDKVKLEGSYWVHYNKVSKFDLDEQGRNDGIGQYLDHRLRLDAVLEITKTVEIFADLDILAGQLWGDTTHAAEDVLLAPRNSNKVAARSMLRELFLQWKSPAGALRVGHMTSQWGLGLVANGGEDRLDEFYDPRHGDIVDRAMFITRPGAWDGSTGAFAEHFYLAIGGGVVFRDDHASIMDGDHAYEGVAALYYDGPVSPTYDLFLGAYGAYRWQEYDLGGTMSVGVVDVFTRHKFLLDDKNTSLTLAAEGALMVGKTDAAILERAPDGMDILNWGAAVRATLDYPTYHLVPSVELGLASGDRDGGDAKARHFSFDPDYQVGMILFSEVLGRSTAWAISQARAADPSLQAVPPQGYWLSATNGAITNALYLYPKIVWSPLKGLDLKAAFLWAQALVPIADPYSSAVGLSNGAAAGGTPRSFRNGPAAKGIGWEIDVGASYKTPAFWQTLAFRFGLQFGYARPGDAFNDAQGNGLDPVWKIRAMADLLFGGS